MKRGNRVLSLILIVATLFTLGMGLVVQADGDMVEIKRDDGYGGVLATISNVIKEQDTGKELEGVVQKIYTVKAPAKITSEKVLSKFSIDYSKNWGIDENGKPVGDFSITVYDSSGAVKSKYSILQDWGNPNAELTYGNTTTINSSNTIYKWSDSSVKKIELDKHTYKLYGEEITLADEIPEGFTDEYAYAEGDYKILKKPGIYRVVICEPATTGIQFLINVIGEEVKKPSVISSVKGNIIVKYMCGDKELGTEEMKNLKLDSYTIYPIDIDGYNLLANEGEQRTVEITKDNLNHTVVFNYSPIKGSILIKYLYGDVELNREQLTDLELKTYNIEYKEFTGYTLEQNEIKNHTVEITKDNLDQTVEFKYVAIPTELKQEPLPWYPLLLIFIIFIPRKRIYIYAAEDNAEIKKDKLLSKKRFTIMEKSEIDLTEDIAKLGTPNLKLVFNRRLSRAVTKKLANKDIYFMNDNKIIATYTVPKVVDGQLTIMLSDIIQKDAYKIY